LSTTAAPVDLSYANSNPRRDYLSEQRFHPLNRNIGAMRSAIYGSPQSMQLAYRQRRQAREARRFAFFAFLTVLSTSLFWFGVLQ
jgi:hypothetical protein